MIQVIFEVVEKKSDLWGYCIIGLVKYYVLYFLDDYLKFFVFCKGLYIVDIFLRSILSLLIIYFVVSSIFFLLLLVWKLQVITYSILNFQKYYIIKCNFISWEIEKLDVFSSTGSRKWILIEIISTKSEFKVKWFLLDIFLWKRVE